MKARRPRFWRMSLAPVFCLAIGVGLLVAPGAQARITRLDVKVVESPTFEGRSFGTVGQYEKLKGKAYGEVDPADPRNAVIVDLKRAPRNARGMVEYSTDVWMVRPVDPAKGNRRVFFEINNRGGLRSFASFNDATSGGNDPTTAADAGNGYLMNRGFTVLEAGWDISAAPGEGRFTVSVPVARKRDGRSITGPSLEEFVIDAPTTEPKALFYAPATLDQGRASLTWRLRYEDPPQSVPASEWAYGEDGQSIRLSREDTSARVGLYELTYKAKDPLVAGLGLAAIRDVASFFRDAEADESGNANPLAGDVEQVYSWGVSQPARTMHDFVGLGFNENEDGDRAINGVLNWIGGATGIFLNYRFAQPFRTHRQHIGRWYPEYEFPFANQSLRDPNTGKVAGRLDRCRSSRTCPKIMEVNSSNEYWAKAMSVLHTDLRGRDIGDAPGVRSYLLSSLPHSASTGLGICQQPRNPLRPNPVLRRLLLVLDQWVSEGREPPASRLPRRYDGTLVPPLPQATEGFPDIPGVTYNGVHHTGDLFYRGPRYDRGILTVVPPVLLGTPYPVLVPKTDTDGNDVAGVRLPEVAVPLATYTGWNLRPSGDGCDANGMRIPFAETRAEREASGDPRLSVEERYPDHETYVKEVRQAANRLVSERFMLPEDAQAYVQAAQESAVAR